MISAIESIPNLLNITEENVRAALDSFVLCSTPPPASPLRELLLVEQFMARSGLQDTSFNRDFALAEILVNLITDELATHRSVIDICPHMGSTCEAGEAAIRVDIKSGNPELIDWSWLYYRYVRTELNMLAPQFASIAHVDERTVRRYQQRGIHRLTCLLIKRELQSRRDRRRQNLYAMLLSLFPPHLYGRGQALHQAEAFLKGLPPHHIQVVGSPGIGKTVLVQELLRLLIDDDRLDDLIWIDTPRSTDQIRKRLFESKPSCDSNQVLLEFASSRRLAVVLDNADHLLYTLKPLVALLAELANAVVFFTTRLPLPLGYPSRCLQLTELDQSDAWTFIRSVMDSYYVEKAATPTDDEIKAVWEATKGNPGKIQSAVFNWRYKSTVSRKIYAVRAG